MEKIAVPKIRMLALPEHEKAFAWALHSELDALLEFLNRFGFALSLFDHLEKDMDRLLAARTTEINSSPTDHVKILHKYLELMRPLYVWEDIAARDGAMTIHDFHRTMINVQQLRKKCETLNSRINGNAFEKCMATFVELFPGSNDVRDAASHPADLGGSPGRYRANAVSGPVEIPEYALPAGSDASIKIANGRKRVYTIHKRLVEYSISQESFERLKLVLVQFYAVFENINEASISPPKR